MGSHPINLAVRFALELSALAAFGVWGWQQGDGWTAIALAVGLPALAAVIWGTFAVVGDPSRSGSAPIAVPGFVRLVLELAVFALATWALYDVGAHWLSLAMGAVVLAHYATSYDRVVWLLRHEEAPE